MSYSSVDRNTCCLRGVELIRAKANLTTEILLERTLRKSVKHHKNSNLFHFKLERGEADIRGTYDRK